MSTSTALEILPSGSHTGLSTDNRSVAEMQRALGMILARRQLIVSTMKEVMRTGQDFGVIPGTPKPTLYKPGAEKLLSMFQLRVENEETDLSTPDTIRYKVRSKLYEIGGGRFVGEGIGVASSDETKYRWRAAVCREEYDATEPTRRQEKWKKGGDGKGFVTLQVRASMEDVDNTVLKMAKKRAMIDATLTTLACSDIFAQDLDSLAKAGLDGIGTLDDGAGEAWTGQTEGDDSFNPPSNPSGNPPAAQPRQETLQRKTQPPQQAPQPAAPAGSGPRISEPQAKRFYAVAMSSGRNNEQINAYVSQLGYRRSSEMLVSQYDAAILWAQGQV